MNKPLKGFITYSHKNKEQKDELRERLAVMEQQNELITWDDGQLTSGDEALQEDILKKVVDSDLLLYLVSAASLASKNCNRELAEALRQEIRVIPIILEHCDWLHHQLSGFEVLPDKGNPLTKWEDESEGWQNVVDGIRKTIHKMQAQANSAHKTSDETNLADQMFQRGNFLIMIGQMEMAIEAYSYAIDLDPRNANAYTGRGVAYANNGKFDCAIEDYDRAIDLKPDDAIAYYNRGNAYLHRNEPDRAIKDYTQAIEFQSDDADAYTGRGVAYARKGEFDRAIADYNKAIRFKSDYSIAYYNRGNAYTRKGDFDNAITNYNKVIQLDPNYAEAYYSRGNAYGKKGKTDLAINNYTQAIEINSDYAEAHNNLGIIHGKQRKYDLAIENFTKAIRLAPDNFNAYYNLGRVYDEKGEYSRAIENYDKTIELNPDYISAYYRYGVAWLHLQEWEKAKLNLIAAKDRGVDITIVFHNAFGSVENFERISGVRLPTDIVDLLIPSQA